MAFKSRLKELAVVLGLASTFVGVSALDNMEVGDKEIDKKDYTGYLEAQDCSTKGLRPNEVPFCPD